MSLSYGTLIQTIMTMKQIGALDVSDVLWHPNGDLVIEQLTHEQKAGFIVRLSTSRTTEEEIVVNASVDQLWQIDKQRGLPANLQLTTKQLYDVLVRLPAAVMCFSGVDQEFTVKSVELLDYPIDAVTIRTTAPDQRIFVTPSFMPIYDANKVV